MLVTYRCGRSSVLVPRAQKKMRAADEKVSRSLLRASDYQLGEFAISVAILMIISCALCLQRSADIACGIDRLRYSIPPVMHRAALAMRNDRQTNRNRTIRPSFPRVRPRGARIDAATRQRVFAVAGRFPRWTRASRYFSSRARNVESPLPA